MHVDRHYQVAVCTTGGYTACPTYHAWAWGPVGAAAPPPVPPKPTPEPVPDAIPPEAAEPEPTPQPHAIPPEAAEPEPTPEPVPDAIPPEADGEQADTADWEAAEVLAVHEALNATAAAAASPEQIETTAADQPWAAQDEPSRGQTATLDDLLTADRVIDEAAPEPPAPEPSDAAVVPAWPSGIAVASALVEEPAPGPPAPEPPAPTDEGASGETAAGEDATDEAAIDEGAPDEAATDEGADRPSAVDHGYRYLPPEEAMAAGAAAATVAPRTAYPADAYARLAGTEPPDEAGFADDLSGFDTAPPRRRGPGRVVLGHLIRSLAILIAAIVVLAALVGVGYVAGRFLVQPGAAPTPAPIITPAPTPAPTSAPPTRSPIATPPPEPTPAPATPKPTAKPKPTPTEKPHATTITYRVKSGDTLYTIAAQFGTTIKAIVEANGIADPNTIVVGQKLVIPIP